MKPSMLDWEAMIKPGVVVHARSPAKYTGVTTGKTRRCQLEGCTGARLGVRWKDKHITWPCSKGMEAHKGEWYIQ